MIKSKILLNPNPSVSYQGKFFLFILNLPLCKKVTTYYILFLCFCFKKLVLFQRWLMCRLCWSFTQVFLMAVLLLVWQLNLSDFITLCCILFNWQCIRPVLYGCMLYLKINLHFELKTQEKYMPELLTFLKNN